MFSKPILIAASVASAEAALMAVSTTTYVVGTNLSDQTGCGDCLSLVTGVWVQGGGAAAQWVTETSANGGTISVSSTTLTGGVCCGSTTPANG